MPNAGSATHGVSSPTPRNNLISARCYHFSIAQPKFTVNRRTHGRRSHLFGLLAAAFFLLSGVLFVPHLGVQNDEALFASPLFAPKDWFYRIRLFHSDIPLLLMSYLGTCKTLIYKFLFQWFGVSPESTRIPMVLAGAGSVWLLWLLLRRLSGQRAALVGCALLTSDSIYLLTTCYDWGPVALQHLLLLAACLLVVRFHQERREGSLFAGFFLAGVAVWDKALALWMLSGICIACILVARRAVLENVNRRRIGLAAAGFCLGASPFLIYNVTHGFATLRENAGRDFSDIAGRARQFENTLDGQGMFGWLVEEDQNTPSPHRPSGPLERLSDEISSLAGHPRHSLMFYGLLLALALAPLARGADWKGILFAAVALAAAWIQMATTKNAGGSVHHIILLWPLPAMIVAISLAAASRRLGRAGLPAVLAVTVLLAGSQILVTNEYFAQTVRNGGTVPWSDGVYTLAELLKTTPSKTVSCVDWGILDALRLLDRGRLPLRWGGDETDASLPGLVSGAPALFVGHTPGREVFQGKTEHLLQVAAGLSYRRKMLAVIADTYGRPTFEVWEFEP